MSAAVNLPTGPGPRRAAATAAGTAARTTAPTWAQRAQRPVRQAGTCHICGDGTSPGYRLCLSCRAVALGLGRPLIPVAAIRTVQPESGLYRALRQYKSGEPEVAQRQSRRLAAILDAFCLAHLLDLAPDGLDCTVVVPSGPGRRPPPHPLATVVASTLHLPPVAELLVPGARAVGPRHPSASAYRSGPGVTGRRVLLVDDVYTSGAHLQSAAVALADAGASAVVAVVIGRFRRAAPRPSDRLAGTPAGKPGDDPPPNRRDTEESVSAPRGMGMGKGGRHLTDRYRNPRPWSTGNHTVRDFGAITISGRPHTS